MLDLSKKVIGPHEQAPIYDLFAVSCHFGGMGGGHCNMNLNIRYGTMQKYKWKLV